MVVGHCCNTSGHALWWVTNTCLQGRKAMGSNLSCGQTVIYEDAYNKEEGGTVIKNNEEEGVIIKNNEEEGVIAMIIEQAAAHHDGFRRCNG